MSYDYRTNDPHGWCGDPKRGAALGRCTIHDAPRADSVKLCLRRIHIDSGGYDTLGTYWGLGKQLYWYSTSDLTIDAVLRANSRDDAKQQVRKEYPSARFY